MLENVKKNLSTSKDKLVPVSFRIEGSTKMLFEHLAHQYGVKPNELLRVVLNAFIDEAADDFKVPHDMGAITWNTEQSFDGIEESTFGAYTEWVRHVFEVGFLSDKEAE